MYSMSSSLGELNVCEKYTETLGLDNLSSNDTGNKKTIFTTIENSNCVYLSEVNERGEQNPVHSEYIDALVAANP